MHLLRPLRRGAIKEGTREDRRNNRENTKVLRVVQADGTRSAPAALLFDRRPPRGHVELVDGRHQHRGSGEPVGRHRHHEHRQRGVQ
jgi:hypothetical protein